MQQNVASDKGVPGLLKLLEVNEMKHLYFPVQEHFPAYTQRQLTHQCCQYFDLFLLSVTISVIALYKRSIQGPVVQN